MGPLLRHAKRRGRRSPGFRASKYSRQKSIPDQRGEFPVKWFSAKYPLFALNPRDLNHQCTGVDSEIPKHGIGQKESDMLDDVTCIHRMANEPIWPADLNLSRGRHHSKASPQDNLRRYLDQKPADDYQRAHSVRKDGAR